MSKHILYVGLGGGYRQVWACMAMLSGWGIHVSSIPHMRLDEKIIFYDVNSATPTFHHTAHSHRYLMSRLSLQVFYLWHHVSSTALPLILWWLHLKILFGPLHRSSPLIGELRCQAIQTEHGPYITERTQKAVYIVRCLCTQPDSWMASRNHRQQLREISQHFKM
jgi:hypothetical protein